MGVPFLGVAQAESGLESSGEQILQAEVEGEGALAVLLPGVHDDGDGERRTVVIDPAELDFTVFVKAPCGLAGDAEAGVIHDPEHAAAGLEYAVSGAGDGGQVLHVLNAKDGGDGVEGTEPVQAGGIADMERDAAGGGVIACGFDEAGGGINAGDGRAAGGDGTGEDALAAAEVEDLLGLSGGEQGERFGDDDLLVDVGAFFPDEPIIPSG